MWINMYTASIKEEISYKKKNTITMDKVWKSK